MPLLAHPCASMQFSDRFKKKNKIRIAVNKKSNITASLQLSHISHLSGSVRTEFHLPHPLWWLPGRGLADAVTDKYATKWYKCTRHYRVLLDSHTLTRCKCQGEGQDCPNLNMDKHVSFAAHTTMQAKIQRYWYPKSQVLRLHCQAKTT